MLNSSLRQKLASQINFLVWKGNKSSCLEGVKEVMALLSISTSYVSKGIETGPLLLFSHLQMPSYVLYDYC